MQCAQHQRQTQPLFQGDGTTIFRGQMGEQTLHGNIVTLGSNSDTLTIRFFSDNIMHLLICKCCSSCKQNLEIDQGQE